MAESRHPLDYQARLAFWHRVGWQPLSSAGTDRIWKRFEQRFGWFGSGLLEPVPSLTWDITPAFRRDQAFLDAVSEDLNYRMVRALRSCTASGERVYALDWQHPCFWFDPRGGVASGDPDEWAVPVLPNGDHFVYLAKDFRFGTIGLMETSVCVFGTELLDAFASEPPAVFTHLLRRDGKPVGGAGQFSP